MLKKDASTKERPFFKGRSFRFFLGSLLVGGFLFAVWWGVFREISSSGGASVSKVMFSEKGEFVVDVADTPFLRMRGLSGREHLPEGYGMLFIFPEPGTPSFWMKDMNFSIDIVWIDPERRIVHIHHDLSPETFPESFSPPQPVRYVLEIPAGAARSIGLVPGDTAFFEL